jgi:hypothetical protein
MKQLHLVHKIWDFHGSKDLCYGLLGYDTV